MLTGMYTVGATSCLPHPTATQSDQYCASAELPPTLNYYVETTEGGFTHMKPMAPIPPEDQNTWFAALVTLHSGTDDEVLLANYFKNPG